MLFVSVSRGLLLVALLTLLISTNGLSFCVCRFSCLDFIIPRGWPTGCDCRLDMLLIITTMDAESIRQLLDTAVLEYLQRSHGGQKLQLDKDEYRRLKASYPVPYLQPHFLSSRFLPRGIP